MATAWNERTLAQMLDLDPRLRGLAARLSHDAHEADDLVQDAWIAVLTQWPGEPCKLEPWAKEVLRNAARKRVRRLQPIEWSEELAEHESSRNGGDELKELARGERAERLRTLIDALPEPYRSTLVQRFYAERTVGEIAAAKGVPRATVSTQLRRALERLRAQLARQRDLLPLVLPWSRTSRRTATGSVQPWAGLRLAIGAIGLVAILPLALAVSSWSDGAGAAGAAPGPLALEAHAAETPDDAALSDRRAVEFSEPAEVALLVEARAERGGAPVAWGRLSAWDESGTLRTCELDGGGRGRLPGLAGARLLLVEVAGSSGTAAGFRHFVQPEQGRLEVRAGSGPLVRFTLSGADGAHPTELRFGLRTSAPGALSSPRLAIGPGSTPGEFLAQLPEALATLNGYDNLDLYVSAADGLHAAEATIDGRALAGERVLELQLELRARLEVELAPEHRGALCTSVVRIVPAGGATAWVVDPASTGRARVGGLRAGKYHVDVEVAGREPWSSEIELAPGASEHVLALAPPEPAAARGPLRGRIVREAAGYDGAILIALEGGRVPQYTQARWIEAEDGFEARFEIQQGVTGAHTLRPIALDGLALFEPPFATIDATTGEWSFECRGRRSPTPIPCELRAADTLAALDSCVLEFLLPGGTYVEYRALDFAASRWAVSSHDFRWKVRDGSPFDWLDESADVRWRLSAPGFTSLEGDRAAWASGRFSVLLQRAPSPR